MSLEKPAKQVLDKKTAKAKAEHFCAYQERSQQEVRDKLYTYGLHSADVENILVELIENNFINEERFAFAYTLGKFRIKHWGKNKIKQALKLKRVSDKLIKKALDQIDPDEYEKSLKLVLEKKALNIQENDQFKRRHKLVNYALSKGYEGDVVVDCLNSSDLLKSTKKL